MEASENKKFALVPKLPKHNLPMNKSSMVAHGQIPPELFDVVFRELHDYTVSFIQNWEQRGSGILVEINGVKGILTAGHVAGPLFRNSEHPVGIVIYNKPHRFEIRQNSLKNIPIPPKDKDPDGFDIPDISFIQFLAPSDIATIAAIKSFYPFRKRPSIDLNSPSAQTAIYAVGGAPLTRGTKTGTPNTESFRQCAKHFFTPAQFKAVQRVGHFDYLSLSLVAGVENYPTSYSGVSGGGMWHIPLFENLDGRLDYHAPELIGIVYFQSELLSQEGRPQARIIRGHSVLSAFDRLLYEINDAQK
ncbi:MAG: hypothetical protein WBW41_02610 [Verrucomicrobiia bacterium]